MIVYRKALPAVVLLVGLLIPQATFAQEHANDSYFQQGRRLFEQRKFQQALPYLHKAAEDSPWDSTAAYYEALCYHQLRDYKDAAKAYKAIVEHFPGSAAYVNAASALRVLEPSYFSKGGGSSSSSSSTTTVTTTPSSSGDEDVSSLLAKVQVSAPNENNIPVQRETDKNWVDGNVNGRTIKFNFSGSTTTLSAADAAALRLSGNSGRVPVSVRIGQINETGFPISIGDGKTSQLGTDFFYQFNYNLGPTHLVATKKSAAGTGYDVPFHKQGSDMIINAIVNGRNVQLVFDTEKGENVVPASRAKEFGLDVMEQSVFNKFDPVNNPDGPLRGQPGYGEMKHLASADAKFILGPVSTNVHFKVDEKADKARVGSSVFSPWKYQVDSAAGKLHLTR